MPSRRVEGYWLARHVAHGPLLYDPRSQNDVPTDVLRVWLISEGLAEVPRDELRSATTDDLSDEEVQRALIAYKRGSVYVESSDSTVHSMLTEAGLHQVGPRVFRVALARQRDVKCMLADRDFTFRYVIQRNELFPLKTRGWDKYECGWGPDSFHTVGD